MKCPSCGQMIEDDLQNCPHCHADVEAAKATVDLKRPGSDPEKEIQTRDLPPYAGGAKSPVSDLRERMGLSEGITLADPGAD
ncbi:hypothetical protein ACFL4W_03900, partial [Planctomycetota bacterium]